MVGPECRLLSISAVASKSYLELGPFRRTNLIGCCLGMAKCLRRANHIELALAWCEEINSLHRVGYWQVYLRRFFPLCQFVHPDWRDWMLDIPELSFLVSSGFASHPRSLHLWTTRARQRCDAGMQPPPPSTWPVISGSPIRRLMCKLLESRHPDPRTANVAVSVPALQVRGSWTRLNVKPGVQSGPGSYYRDLWTLDLVKLNEWRRLPDYPIPFGKSGIFLGWNFVVHTDIALLFVRRPSIDFFDLKAETWGCFETTYAPTPEDLAAGVIGGWPYPGMSCMDATMQIVNNTLYVFGGSHSKTRLGCNLFMALDLSTRRWRRLSGTVHVTEDGDYSCPGPRKSAASWVSPDRARIYVLFGNCDRDAAHFHNERHASDTAFAHTDFWSWNVKHEIWRQERMAGNPPCARTEMGYAYNEKLQQAVVFGGYAYLVMNGREGQFPYTYFADTFVCDMAPTSDANGIEPKWRQVVTPGIPTYRCQAHMQCDPAKHRTEVILTRTKLGSRSFSDLWEVPGGHFEVDAADSRVARAGPWQRCFTCAAAGPWKKCGRSGVVKGVPFSVAWACLRQGWKEHKQLHKCCKP
ncbi:hypothetical protein B0H17DRAFT_1236319 [Mycena rosella]|uniref:Kelch repeat protein n=1 Tax=Mycena rosella TaxID=1033263 RepID=A0AAD7G8F9_MYCRO|nr:hypothetical protein B0H17DRAFT_1236319 [Mycena rosella]